MRASKAAEGLIAQPAAHDAQNSAAPKAGGSSAGGADVIDDAGGADRSHDLVSGGDGHDKAVVQERSAPRENLFELLDTERAGVISVRQLLVAFSAPSAELRAKLDDDGLELVKLSDES